MGRQEDLKNYAEDLLQDPNKPVLQMDLAALELPGKRCMRGLEKVGRAMMSLRGQPQKDIAQEAGISKQAVSKSIEEVLDGAHQLASDPFIEKHPTPPRF